MRINPWKVTTLALLAGIAVTQFTGLAEAERQPHMRTALRSLKIAKTQLQKATHDKGGHRVKAIALVDQAITEVEAGIAFDNKH